MENTNHQLKFSFGAGLLEEKEELWMVWVDNLFFLTMLLLWLATMAWFIKTRMGG